MKPSSFVPGSLLHFETQSSRDDYKEKRRFGGPLGDPGKQRVETHKVIHDVYPRSFGRATT